MKSLRGPSLRPFWVMAAGELTSELGSMVTMVAVDIWVYEQTRSVTMFASVHVLAALAAVVLSPFAGALVDRLNRRRVMIAANAGLVLITLVLAVFARAHRLNARILIVSAPIFAMLGCFRGLASSAATAQLVPPEEFARVRGRAGTVGSLSSAGGRLAAGFLLQSLGMHGVLLVDAATTLVAIATVASIALPDPPKTEQDGRSGDILRETLEGLRFIMGRRGLFGLLVASAAIMFGDQMASLLLTPLLLSTSTGTVVGSIRAVAVMGVFFGSLALGLNGGPRNRKVLAVLGCCAASAGLLVSAGLRVSIFAMAFIIFSYGVIEPITGHLAGAVWLAKTPAHMVGRCNGLRTSVSSAVFFLVAVVAGPLADGVFEPALQPGAWLAPTVGRLVGTGTGRGIGAMFVLLGLAQLVVIAIAWCNARIRSIETEIPDAGLAINADDALADRTAVPRQ